MRASQESVYSLFSSQARHWGLSSQPQGSMASRAAKTSRHERGGIVSSEACWRRAEAIPLLPICQRVRPNLSNLPPIPLQSLSFNGGVTPSTYVTSPENIARGEPKASLRSRSRGGCENSSEHAGRAPSGQRNCSKADIQYHDSRGPALSYSTATAPSFHQRRQAKS